LPTRTEAEIQVVVSQPYAGWHELCICYEINAWILLNREIRGAGNIDSADAESIPYAFARFKNSDGRFAYLIYSAVDAEGNIFEPPPRPGRLGNRFTEYFGDSQITNISNLMMMQMFIVSNAKLEPESLREFAADFVQMRSIIQKNVQERHSTRSINDSPVSENPVTEGRSGK
jgi:hypothetical protein